MPSAHIPDIASSVQSQAKGKLNWVGMDNIHIPITVHNLSDIKLMATVGIFVNFICANRRGIHMSRLHLALDNFSEQYVITPPNITLLLAKFINSHQGLSDCAHLSMRFNYPIRRASLKSDNTGWQTYPVEIIGSIKNNNNNLELKVKVPYSSTCPCSASLARDVITQNFSKCFPETQGITHSKIKDWLSTPQGILATPHSQRSFAEVKVKLMDNVTFFPITKLITDIEQTLKTPVQSVVKREDEREFTLLNGQNLMFCEDAARRLQEQLNQQSQYADFWLKVTHLESLHSHNAVSVTVKDVAGGYQPNE